jgi:hypothetical protein
MWPNVRTQGNGRARQPRFVHYLDDQVLGVHVIETARGTLCRDRSHLLRTIGVDDRDAQARLTAFAQPVADRFSDRANLEQVFRALPESVELVDEAGQIRRKSE